MELNQYLMELDQYLMEPVTRPIFNGRPNALKSSVLGDNTANVWLYFVGEKEKKSNNEV
jgi:hypothetical protein